jgi:hypothetical protein
VGGRVVEDSQSKAGISTGSVLLIFRNDSDPDNPQVVYESVRIHWDGRFIAEIPEKAREIEFITVQAYYLPTSDYGDCYSQIIEQR